MKKYSTAVLIVLFVVLAIVVYLMIRPSAERETSYSVSELNIAVDSAQVTAITILHGGKTTCLEDIGGVWNLVNLSAVPNGRYPADDAAVKRLLGAVQKQKITSLISINPQKQSLYQVDSTGTQLTLKDRSGRTVGLIVGKMGPSFSETYIRPSGSNEVYLAEGLMAWDVNKETKDWRDKTIYDVKQDSIKSLAYRYPKDEFTLLRDSVWMLGKDTAFVTEVNGVLSTLASLRADDFVDSAMDLSHAQFQVDFTEKNTYSLTFVPLPPDSSRYVLKTSHSPQLFIVNKWSVKPIMKQRKEFLPSTK